MFADKHDSALLDRQNGINEVSQIGNEQDPENATFYFAQGVFTKLEDEENAIEAYQNAIEPIRIFLRILQSWRIYYNKGVKQIEYANTIPRQYLNYTRGVIQI